MTNTPTPDQSLPDYVGRVEAHVAWLKVANTVCLDAAAADISQLLSDRARLVEEVADWRFKWNEAHEQFAEDVIAFNGQVRAAEAHVERLTEALTPFGGIKPSSFYPADGSEEEEYVVLLKGDFGNKCEFTGADLRAAREALSLNGRGVSPSGDESALVPQEAQHETAVLSGKEG